MTIRGEADYDADWGLASVCSSANPDQFCPDASASHVDPSCGSIAHVDWSYLNETLSLSAGTYYLWVDGWSPRGELRPGGDLHCTGHQHAHPHPDGRAGSDGRYPRVDPVDPGSGHPAGSTETLR